MGFFPQIFVLVFTEKKKKKKKGIVKQVVRIKSGIWNLSHTALCLKKLI